MALEDAPGILASILAARPRTNQTAEQRDAHASSSKMPGSAPVPRSAP
jgi:hypothetical protein